MVSECSQVGLPKESKKKKKKTTTKMANRISVTTSTSNHQHHTLLSSQSLPDWTNQLDSSTEMVRHTTKLLKSRDSRTGRLIINQYMKGKELGRGVHGIVYIGKNMDKLIRTSPPTPNPTDELIEEERACTWTEEDYETVAIKVVRREPRGPKSLRRSQMQRQQQREAAALNGQQAYISDSGVNEDSDGYLSPHHPTTTSKLLVGRLPLLKDVDDKLKKEIAIMKRLRHKHIVQLKEVIDDAKSKKVFMILEFMEGGQVLWQDPLTQTPLMTVEQARNTFRQVLLGLEYLHYQGIIHRDIKPANLLWTSDRTTVKISDFGVSHISGVLKRSSSNCNLPASIIPNEGVGEESPRTMNSTEDKALRKTEGSPAFMAPELCCPIEATPGITPSEATALDYFTQERRRSSTLSKQPISNSTEPNNCNTPTLPLTSSPTSLSKEINPSTTIDSSRLISLPLSSKTYSKGERPVIGKAIDIWALGVTLYCLLFGRTPFNAPNEYELFNVIWNEPILIPDTMAIERQSLIFDPTNPNLDGPVQRDSRELVDLLGKLLEKDPRKRIKLEDVKVHPWVLNNLDNTQHWVHETAPVGGDAVYVTTEEVANFSRPRASLTTHKPLFGVKQSLRKAAIKLGLTRPTNQMSRMRSKSASSGASASPSPQVETAFPILNPRQSPLSSNNSRIRQKISIDTTLLPASTNLRPETPPITPSLPLSFPLNTSSSIKRGFGVCSGWSSSNNPKSTTILSSSSRQNHPPQPISPIHSNNRSRPQTPVRFGGPPSQSCLSSVSSRSGSPSQYNPHPSTLPVPRTSSPSTHSLSQGLDPSIIHPHMLLDPISFSIDKNNNNLNPHHNHNHRRSLPSSPAPLHALTSLSRTSLIPPRTASPSGLNCNFVNTELDYRATTTSTTRLAPPPTWFRDALFKVKRRFTRSSHSRRNSHLTDLTNTSDDLERTPIQCSSSGTSHPTTVSNSSSNVNPITTDAGGGTGGISREFFDQLRKHRAPSEVFSSDAEACNSIDGRQTPHSRVGPQTTRTGGVAVDCEDEEHKAENQPEADDDDDDDDDDESDEGETLGKPLMYHNGTKWTYPAQSQDRSMEGSKGAEQDSDGGVAGTQDWIKQILVEQDNQTDEQSNLQEQENHVVLDVGQVGVDLAALGLIDCPPKDQEGQVNESTSTSTSTLIEDNNRKEIPVHRNSNILPLLPPLPLPPSSTSSINTTTTNSPWGQPRLTFRPASTDNHSKFEYRSSDDDDDEEDNEEEEDDDDGHQRYNEDRTWKWKHSRDLQDNKPNNAIISSSSTTRTTPTTSTSTSTAASLDFIPLLPLPVPLPSSSSSSSPIVVNPPLPNLGGADRNHGRINDRNLDHITLQDHHHHQGQNEEDEEDDDEADDDTLQIEVKRRKRGCSRSEGS
ncbi:hypothetical protein Pst134EA_015939 [Puccinia striiformis f. sp. tritici]|uniref:hypothetical protein n=1 Tax=Puccinia striiformis f. sp. tritici TaxID=168172 RepID=UPI0020071E79|nr:hypothetical protein Pst134EA_015939 [Puccinia striiformis f. sp. tritici]KAH9463859.1 hypothetical protein Pst134EA_015939 [Puccinia striiformis f. sp. tritici]